MTFTSPCKICGGPVNLEIPDELQDITSLGIGFATLLRDKVAPMVACDACLKKRTKQQGRIDQVAVLQQRIESWATLCPPCFQDTDPAELPHQLAHAALLRWAWPISKGLVLHGPTGSGKTRSLLVLFKREVEAGRTVVFMRHADFARSSLELLDNLAQRRRWFLLLERADILAIDDLGKAKFTDFGGRGRESEEALCNLFERRIGAKLPTFWTTEWNSATLLQSMSLERGPAFVRRLKENCSAVNYGRVDQTKHHETKDSKHAESK
jgi:hypothetical protein